MAVDFITFCHPKHIHRLHEPGKLAQIVATHRYPFNDIIVVHQRCQGIQYQPFDIPCRIVESENHPNVLTEFGLPEYDAKAENYTHGPQAAHYWKWHTINHLIGLKESSADYVVFSDCDCEIRNSHHERSWVEEAIDILKNYREVLIVGPGDGGHIYEKRIPQARLTKNVSQQMFLCERERFKKIDFNLPWDWEYKAPGEPFQEYYYMMEGRIWRWLDKHNLWRAVLPDTWRYWHNQW